MINEGHKRIGFRQKVPYRVLENGLFRRLQHGKIEPSEIDRDLQERFAGANRLAKAASTVNLILNKNEFAIQRLERSISADSFIKLRESERQALITCLLCIAYPIAYDCLVAMARVFKLQDAVSRDLLHQKLSSFYGSNRSVYIAVGELLPTYIELGFLSRIKASVYQKNPPIKILHSAVAEILIYTDIKLSNSNSILVEDVTSRPWYDWFEITEPGSMSANFVTFADGLVGRGYLTATKGG